MGKKYKGKKTFQTIQIRIQKRRKKIQTIPNLIDILNALRRWLDLPDEFRECYETLPKESANEYNMIPIDWERLFPDL